MKTSHIPLVDLHAQRRQLEPKLSRAIQDVLKRGDFIGGTDVAAFETNFARTLGVRHCIGVGNGTDALALALKALGLVAGDEVITAANSFIASAEAISMTGATPRFVDIDPATHLMDLHRLDALLTSQKPLGKIKAIIPVHLYGRALDMTSLIRIAKRHDVYVVEDCAQAHLARHNKRGVGGFGEFGCFSFYPGKNLGAYGDAGAVVTNDDARADRIRMLRNHGRLSKFDHEIEGVNSRLDTLQAAILNVKLPRLAAWNRRRIAIAGQYSRRLAGIAEVVLPHIPTDGSHVFHLFVIRAKNRGALQRALAQKGISTGIHYPVSLPNLSAYRTLGYRREDFPIASAYEKEILSLPLYPEMTSRQIDSVCQVVKKFYQSQKTLVQHVS